MWFFYGFAWIPIYWFLTKGSSSQGDLKLNSKLNAQIEELKGLVSQVELKLESSKKRGERLGFDLMSVREQLQTLPA